MPDTKPTPTDVAKRIKREAHIRTISLGDIRVSPAAQRELNMARVNKIADSLDVERLGTLTVSHRDGFYWLVDGQHRFNALKTYWGDGFEEWEVEAWCYEGLTEAQEAEKFLQHNEVLAVTAYDKFKVGVTAGRLAEADIDRIVRSLGLKVARNQGAGSISAVASLTNVYGKFGPKGLVQTLWAIRESFGDGGFDGDVILGIALFIARFEGRLDSDRLVKKLRTVNAGVKGLLSRAYITRERTQQTRQQCVASVVTEVYNSGLRGTASLGTWWKNEKAAA